MGRVSHGSCWKCSRVHRRVLHSHGVTGLLGEAAVLRSLTNPLQIGAGQGRGEALKAFLFTAHDVLFKPPSPWAAAAKPGARAFVLPPALSQWEVNLSLGPLGGLQQPQEFGVDRKMFLFVDTEG